MKGLLKLLARAGEPRLAARTVDPGQHGMAAALAGRIGKLWGCVDDPAARPQFDALLKVQTLQTLLGLSVVTNCAADPQTYWLTRVEGARGHCEGMASAVFWIAAFDRLDATVR